MPILGNILESSEPKAQKMVHTLCALQWRSTTYCLSGVDQGEDPVHAEVQLFPFPAAAPSIIQICRGVFAGNPNPQTK